MNWLKGESLDDKLIDMHSHIEISWDRDLGKQIGTGADAHVIPFQFIHSPMLESLYVGFMLELEGHHTGVFYELA